MSNKILFIDPLISEMENWLRIIAFNKMQFFKSDGWWFYSWNRNSTWRKEKVTLNHPILDPIPYCRINLSI